MDSSEPLITCSQAMCVKSKDECVYRTKLIFITECETLFFETEKKISFHKEKTRIYSKMATVKDFF